MQISINTKQMKSIYNKLDKILDNIPKYAETGLKQALEDTKKTALENKKGSKDDNLILTELKNEDGLYGRIYTNFDYAPFLEYGTGIKSDGEMPHIGTTKTFKESGMRYWYMPLEKADREFSPNRIININGKQFVIMFATQPFPFMRTTAFFRHDLNVKEISNAIKKGIKNDLK